MRKLNPEKSQDVEQVMNMMRDFLHNIDDYDIISIMRVRHTLEGVILDAVQNNKLPLDKAFDILGIPK